MKTIEYQIFSLSVKHEYKITLYRIVLFLLFGLMGTSCTETKIDRNVLEQSERIDARCSNFTPPNGGHNIAWCNFNTKKRNNLVLQSASIEGTPFVLEIQKRTTDYDANEYECDYVIYNVHEKREVLRIYSHVWSQNPADFFAFSTDRQALVGENRTALYLSPQKTGLVVDAFWNADHEESEPIYIYWGMGQPQRSKNIIIRNNTSTAIEENIEMAGWCQDVPVFVVK